MTWPTTSITTKSGRIVHHPSSRRFWCKAEGCTNGITMSFDGPGMQIERCPVCGTEHVRDKALYDIAAGLGALAKAVKR